jgi:hypothetical protein
VSNTGGTTTPKWIWIFGIVKLTWTIRILEEEIEPSGVFDNEPLAAVDGSSNSGVLISNVWSKAKISEGKIRKKSH